MNTDQPGRGRSYTYAGEQLREVAMPLGGIGAGCVSLEGRGALRDWEIFNRPAKGNQLPMSFPVLWCQPDRGAAQTRVVHGPPNRDFMGGGGAIFAGFGHTMRRDQGDGLPHFSEAVFTGTFPLARIEFRQPGLPLDVSLTAFSPFIPLDHRASSMPVACLTYRLKNVTDAPVRATLAMNLGNGVGQDQPPGRDQPTLLRHERRDGTHCRGLTMTCDRFPADHSRFGSMALSTDWPDVSVQQYWQGGVWYDPLHHFWDMFSPAGELRDDIDAEQGLPVGSLGLKATLAPGEAVELPVLISWCFPNFQKYWGAIPNTEGKEPEQRQEKWTNHYATHWPDAWAAAEDFFANRAALTRRTEAFARALFDSTLPEEVIESVSATASILHSPTCLQYEDGTFWCFEGCAPGSGCCVGSCTHVWNYAQTPAHLFPALHRTMRESEYRYSFDQGEPGKQGAVVFRIPLPLGAPATLGHAASDGQLGGIVQLYRDWRFCGDDDYLQRMWPGAKKALEFAWTQWDRNRDGLVEGDQHNTYDINFQGPNPLTQFFYLAALRAGERIARHLGEDASADEYGRLAERGAALTIERLYNGEYFEQDFDCLAPDAPKYQHGKGCLSDQVFGQLAAHVAGLDHLLDAELIRSALSAIWRHNFRDPLGDHANMQRIYAVADEPGLLLCSWPRGGRPAYPFVYSDEVWTGIEYQVASHLIYEGLVDEGLAIVQAVRLRYEGKRRNPYNEFECGSHYARALASWGVLLALSGFRYDAVDKTIYLTPRGPDADRMRCFFSTASVWGVFDWQAPSRLRIELIEGELTVEAVVTAAGSVDVPPDARTITAGSPWTLG